MQLMVHFLIRKFIGTFFRYKVEIGSNKLIFAEPEVLANQPLYPVSRHSISQLATCCYAQPGPFRTIFCPEYDEVASVQLLSGSGQ
jgi:hypothetical protein